MLLAWTGCQTDPWAGTCPREGDGCAAGQPLAAVLGFGNLHHVLRLQVGQWLQANKLAAYVEVFREMEITGADLHGLEDDELKKHFVCRLYWMTVHA